MSERDIIFLLEDILESIQKIQLYTQGYTLEDYQQDSKTKDAVERNFEIIGEAASRMPDHFKTLHQTIEWRILKDFRNFIIHEYFGINSLIVWETIQLRLGDLEIEMIKVIGHYRK